MKTTIQELIENLEKWMLDDKYVQDNPLKYEEYMVQHANQMVSVKRDFVILCESMLEKEKEVIMDTYDTGWSDAKQGKDLNDLYYFETFSHKEE